MVILVPPPSGFVELHPILLVVCCYFVATGSSSSKETPRGTRVVATVAIPASGYPLAPTMARGLQPLHHYTSAACHVRARGAGDVPDGNDALWSFKSVLSRVRQPWVQAFLRKRQELMCPSLYRGPRKASDRRRLVIERMGGGFHWRHHYVPVLLQEKTAH